METADVWALYHAGKLAEALAGAEELISGADTAAQADGHAIKAWIHYRRKEYEAALREIAIVQDHERALVCHVYILAYAPNMQDDALLSQLLGRLGPNVDAANAFVIRARANDSTLAHEQVWTLAESFADQANAVHHSVSTANLLHNAARFFLGKSRGMRDLAFALGLLDGALAHYGEVSNWHHRAAAHFWRSHVLEKMTDIPAAFASAAKSLLLWNCQCQLEKDTAPFADKLENAIQRVAVLSVQLKLFALRSLPQQ